MAYETGTATDHDNLLSKLITFLTTAGGGLPTIQQWTQLADRVESGQRCVYLKGPGLAGTDNIYVGIRVKTDAGAIVYHWEMRGMAGWDTNAVFDSQIGVSPPYYMPLFNSSMAYRFFANGRHFKVISVVEGTIYANCYGGFSLPYALPSEFPYPLFIGANSYLATERYDSTAATYRAFWMPGDDNNAKLGACGLRFITGDWLPFSDQDSDDDYGRIWPYFGDQMPMIANKDASQNVVPLSLYTDKWDGLVIGELDGVGYISGHGTTPGDIIEDEDSDEWECFNSCSQVGIGNMVAFKKEV